MPGLKEARRFLQDAFERDQEELRIWRERYPRSAANVREEACAKVEGREPDYGPVRAWL